MKRNAILLQEAYRRDGHADFIKRASEVCGVPRSTLKRLWDLYVTVRDWNIVKATAISSNVLQTRTVSTSKRVCREIRHLNYKIRRGQWGVSVPHCQRQRVYRHEEDDAAQVGNINWGAIIYLILIGLNHVRILMP